MEATCISSDSLDGIALESGSGNASDVTVPTLYSSTDPTMEEDPDCSLEDTREAQTVDEFMSKGCSCQVGVQGSPCSQQLSEKLLVIVLSQSHSLPNAAPARNKAGPLNVF